LIGSCVNEERCRFEGKDTNVITEAASQPVDLSSIVCKVRAMFEDLSIRTNKTESCISSSGYTREFTVILHIDHPCCVGIQEEGVVLNDWKTVVRHENMKLEFIRDSFP